MPLQTINYAGIPIQKPDYSGLENFIPNMLSGYKAAKEPARMRAEQEKLDYESQTAKMNNYLKQTFGIPEAEAALEGSRLGNQALRTKEEFARPRHEAELALMRAQTGHADRSERGMGGKNSTPLEKANAGYERAVDQYGKDSQEAKAAKIFVNKTAGLKENKLEPRTAAANEAAYTANSQKSLLDPIMQHKYKGASADLDLNMDRRAYAASKDPNKLTSQLGKDLVQYGLATKVAPEFVSLQLKGQRLEASKFNKESQEKAAKLGWPFAGKLQADFFTNDLQKEIDKQHNKILEALSEDATRTTAELKERKNESYINALKPQSEQNNRNGQEQSKYSDADIEHTARKKGITTAEVRKRLGIQ